MKKTTVLLLMCLSTVVAVAQNVGVHIANPTEKLQVDSGNIKIGREVWSAGREKFLKFGDNDYVKIGENLADDFLTLDAAKFVFYSSTSGYTGNVGIGVLNPQQKLEVDGTVKADNIAVTQGNQYDVLKKGAGSDITYNKGTKAVGLTYMIATQGIFPSQPPGNPTYNTTIIGEIRLFAGNFVPAGFLACNGQLLSINNYQTLFSLLGTQYGGNGTTTFALPDLRGAVPVGSGTPANGAAWTIGEVN